MTVVVGIDPSLTHTVMHGPGTRASIQTRPKDYPHGIARLAAIRDRLETWLAAITPGVAYVEGYAYGARYNREALGELGGVVRLALADLQWSVVVVPPTMLKKFVTGAGNGEKDHMMREIWKRWQYDATDNNDADAYALMRLGMAHQGLEAATKVQAAALAKLEVLR